MHRVVNMRVEGVVVATVAMTALSGTLWQLQKHSAQDSVDEDKDKDAQLNGSVARTGVEKSVMDWAEMCDRSGGYKVLLNSLLVVSVTVPKN